MCIPLENGESYSFHETLLALIASEQIAVMKDEINLIEKNLVKELVDLSFGHKSIGNKWFLD